MYIPLLKQEIWMVIFMDWKSGRPLPQSPQRLVQWMFNMFLEEQWSGLTAVSYYAVVATSHLARCWFVCHWALKIMMWCPSAQRWQAGHMSSWSGLRRRPKASSGGSRTALALRMHAVAPPPVVALCWPRLRSARGANRSLRNSEHPQQHSAESLDEWPVLWIFLNKTQHKLVIVYICLFNLYIYIYL